MRGKWQDENRIAIELNRDELLLLNNALNEVCNGANISDREFETRLGVRKSTGRGLLREMNELHDARNHQSG